MRVFQSFTKTIIAFRDGEISRTEMNEAFFVFNCHELHLFPESDCYAPYEITWNAPNAVSLLKCALPEHGLLVTDTLPKEQADALKEFRVIIKRAKVYGRAVFMKSATVWEKLKFAYQLAVALGMRKSSDGSVWPDMQCRQGMTTGYLPHPESEEAKEMLAEGALELEDIETAFDSTIRRMADDANR